MSEDDSDDNSEKDGDSKSEAAVELDEEGDESQQAEASASLFRSEVQKYRKLNSAMKKETLQGGMFYARDAKKRGIVDSIGTMKNAIKRAKALT